MTRKHSDATYVTAYAVKALIDRNPLGRKSLAALTRGIHIGRNQLQEAFKEITGRTFRRYRLEKRMEAAGELLISCNMRVYETAKKCGYKRTPNNFSRDFKLILGLTPEEWLQLHINQYNSNRQSTL